MSEPQDGGQGFSSSPKSQPAVVHSSAAFLHHLHTDPSSHHITLSASTTRLGGTAPNKSPKSISIPLEPTVVERNKPTVSPDKASTLAASSRDGEPVAGPSSVRNLVRNTSRRGRPNTAPAYKNAHASSFSPDVEDPSREEFPFEGSSSEDLPQLLSSGDVCISALTPEISDTEHALEMAGEGAQRSRTNPLLLGSAGSFRQGASSPPLEGDATPPERLGWNTFARSYAHGLFDPNKIPNPPQPSFSPTEPASVHSSPGKRYAPTSVVQRRSETNTTTASGSSRGTIGSSASGSSAATLSTHASSAPSTSFEKQAPATSVPIQAMAAELPTKMQSLELDSIQANQKNFMRPDKLSLPSYSLAAATVRMASTHLRDVDLAPLGMPSPERELMDPMSSVVSADSITSGKESASSDPGISRFPLSRSMSSAVGTSHVHQTLLPTIQASPVSTPSEHPHKGKAKASQDQTKTSPSRLRGGVIAHSIPPASAPIERTMETQSAVDYFGSIESPHYSRQPSYNSHSSSSQTATEKGTPIAHKPATTPNAPLSPKAASEGSPEFSLPPLARPNEIGPLYEKLGWLPAPVPPNEQERRKALYRFNILHTSTDVNFDRIAHMAKLVFNTKIVLIALTDTESQWHKSQSGLGAEEAARISSFCSHTLLSKTDEPFVVLDATQDWRFANNPQVVGAPHIRFYAGAPLRTVEGYNLGSLCVIDDKPRSEFPPRSRLILKEFAAVTMREMELWRDKLQLRVRDKIQNSMERFTRECLEMDATTPSNAEAAAKMDQVYARAATLVCQTLDLDGCFVLDIGQFEMTEVETPTGSQIVFRADPYIADTQSPVLERSDTFGPVNPFPVLATTPNKVPTRPLSAIEHEKLSTFLRDNRDGRIFENIAPSWIRYMFPPGLRYGMVVPVFGVDQQPFAMICAYNCNKSKQYLEGYELQFLRAIGVIILSAVLRRRMVLADKTKSILISSVSHELRTPLHGILAAAELLSDTKLDANQISFLKTVQTCGNSLIETVNHVLDFTKLSGSAQSSGAVIRHSRVNLASLVESTVESCWIGQRARFFHGDSDIGSFYAPDAPSALIPKAQRATVGAKLAHVETIIDIGQRERGWIVRCERGGLRRVLMNLVGNSLKFTTDGYVHVSLRELPHPPGSKKIPIEMAVVDTGKGISKEFLKDHLFHPFSQENPLQTGTGLGLAIVNSIVRSDSVDGKVDVWSSEGRGTEIRVSFEAEVVDDEEETSSSASSVVSMSSSPGRGHSVSFLGFSPEYPGHTLSLDCLSTYAAGWQFELKEGTEGGILIVNDDDKILHEVQGLGKPVLFITSGRHGHVTSVRDKINREGGLMQIMYKPIGPSAFRGTLTHAVDFLENGEEAESHDATTPSLEERERPSMSRGSSGASAESNSTVSELSSKRFGKSESRVPLMRRRSEENEGQASTSRPSLAPRGMTYHHAPKSRPIRDDVSNPASTPSVSSGSPQPGSPTSTISTISLADGGVMLKSAAVTVEGAKKQRQPRVMIVEDNIINRTVLGAYLKKKGAEYHEAVDGKAGVDLFENTPPNHWDVILMDISMPVMNGHEATRAIRKIEAARRHSSDLLASVPSPGRPLRIPPPKVVQARVKIFALTGLATSDDKREAFSSGVDGYLVKPVSLKSLGLIFQRIGFSMESIPKAEAT